MSAEGSETSNSLLDQVKAGDQDSWRKLEFVYKPLVIYWALDCSIPASDVEDLSQDILQSIFRKIDSFNRVDRYSFRGWLKKITLNRCLDYHRQSHRIPEPSDIVESITVSYRKIDDSSYFDPALTTQKIDFERNTLLKQVFVLVRQEFSPRDIEVFCDLVGRGIEPAAVAEKHRVSRNTVYKIKCKILAKVRQEFDGLLDFEK